MIIRVALFIVEYAVCHRFRLDGRQDDLAAVRDEDGAGTAAVGSVDKHARFPRFLDDAFDRRRFGADDGNDTIARNEVAESDVD